MMFFPGIKLYAILAAATALIAFGIWFSDKIGDSRELAVRQKEVERQEKQNDAENSGRLRARNCHTRGADWLWDPATEKCNNISMRKTGE